jgi:transcriptional regulator with XRE-family HTH domain
LNIQNRLKEVRKHFDMTQTDFANIFGLKQGHYSKYELGQLELSTSMLVTINQKFNIDIHWLLTGIGSMFYVTGAEHTPNLPIDIELMQETIAMAQRVLEKKRVKLKPDKFAQVVIELYKFTLVTESKMADNNVEKLLKLA